MATFEGVIISLPEAKLRRRNIKQNLKKLGHTNNYKWFPAIQGSHDQKNRKGLSKGEHGLWLSILTILESSIDTKSDYLHLLEDDAVLSSQFFEWVTRLPSEPSNTNIYFTDMWVGKQNFHGLKDLAKIAKKKNKTIAITDKSYSGCTASWLIHKKHIPYVRSLLRHGFETINSTRIPLDNFIRRLIYSSKLSVKVSLPFLTSIDLYEQYESSIQDSAIKAVQATRVLECLLRRRLSVLSEPKDLNITSQILNDLMTSEEIDEWLAESLLPYLEGKNKYQYTMDKRLAIEP